MYIILRIKMFCVYFLFFGLNPGRTTNGGLKITGKIMRSTPWALSTQPKSPVWNSIILCKQNGNFLPLQPVGTEKEEYPWKSSVCSRKFPFDVLHVWFNQLKPRFCLNGKHPLSQLRWLGIDQGFSQTGVPASCTCPLFEEIHEKCT